MICFETEYLNIGRVLLLAVGMWPYKQSKLISLQVILCYTLLLSIMIVQFTPFLTAECSPDLVIKILSMVLFCSTYTIIYNSFQINKHIIRSLMDHLQRIFNTIKDDYEIAILRKYGYNARCYEFACAVFSMCCFFIVFMQPWWPRILNILPFINISESYHAMYFITEYFVDDERYLYLIMLHINMVFCVGTFVVLAAGTFLIACAKCNCGMFTIASYRVEHAMDIYIPQRIDLKNEFMITNKIIQAVDIHRKSMKLIRDFISTFERTLFCIIIISVVCLSLNFYRIFQVVSFDGNVEEFIVHSTVVSIIFIYIFIINYFAQEILDHNNEIFIAVYNTRWYTAPLCIQKMILFLLQRGTRGFNLKIGGLFLACLESSATLISTSMSYFTVLCSM
ncbi:odorant receptor 4-like isoform X1 [Harpegnathos saltator]|uniref:odorant receptor 4-like isoform X1 n=1 Tax=Harpegnathos saltator TaxID=610380 RepID=UPI000948DA74|nr:odorant receptor 4-like isoform X1 [Harpegnathos saltator]XP_019700310.1 odorant receptor 4-like isoform X1 [Harpegnathos saltator]XP_025162776.1 odorant receptor 4-like isoform X1 [Harpegnathos saltator]